MSQILTLEEIKDRIPHRYENLLIDQVEISDNPEIVSGDLKLTITESDPLDRAIFTQNISGSNRSILVTTSMEILALASIVCSGKLEANQSVFFAGISNFEKFNDLPTNAPIKGHTEKVSDKGGFLKYSGTLTDSEGTPLVKGDMLAVFIDGTPESKGGKKKIEAPIESTDLDPGFSEVHKDKWMRITDKVVNTSEAPNGFTTRYTYPEDHPFIKGHFPNNPVMMGVMQWMSIEDASLAYALHQKLTGVNVIKGDCNIVKKDGTLVAEIKAFEVLTDLKEGSETPYATIQKTKRISFRDFVKPGETLYIQLFNLNLLPQ